MTLLELCVDRRLFFVTLFLMTDTVLNYGSIMCTGIQQEVATNSSSGRRNDSLTYDFLTLYSTAVLNQTRQLEEIIYSDIINNLRILLTLEKNQSGELSKNDIRGKKKESANDECEKSEKRGNVTNSRTSVNSFGSYKTNVFLTGTKDFKSGDESKSLFDVQVPKFSESEYLLGYSGNPFGSRKPMTGIVSVDPSQLPNGESFAEDPRKKRSVLHLYNMVLCATGCNPFGYKGYGCYCGFLGSGFVVDGIDSCCKMHDWCYNSAGCPMFLEYFIPYLWKCYQRQPLCAINHGYYGGPGSCAQRLCECDRQLALCLRRYPCPTTKALCTSSPWRLLQNILML